LSHQAPEPSRPAGTVYGRGGDVGTDTPAGLPRAVQVVAGVGVVAMLALGYAAWNSTAGGGDEPAAAAVAPVPPAAESAVPPAAPPPARLATGSWLLSPLGDPNTYLTVNGEFAKMSPADPATLTVVTGLADDTCFSFRVDGDRYLRHFDYRLRVDETDDSDLFRADATFCQETGADAGTVRLRSKNYPDHLLHHRDDGTLYIDKPASGTAAGFAFMVQPSV
jgi:hypothetical protein